MPDDFSRSSSNTDLPVSDLSSPGSSRLQLYPELALDSLGGLSFDLSDHSVVSTPPTFKQVSSLPVSR
jgi:hypothetical protein